MMKKEEYLPRLILLFMACQIIIDSLHSVTIFPFFHYAMYSEVFTTQEIDNFEIIVNGKPIRATEYNITTWDLINIPLSSVQKQSDTHDFAFDKHAMEIGMKAIGLQSAFTKLASNLNNSSQLPDTFKLWYKAYLQKMLHYSIKTLQINKMHYSYRNANYRLLKKEEWINI
jgi:hypothetical protein